MSKPTRKKETPTTQDTRLPAKAEAFLDRTLFGKVTIEAAAYVVLILLALAVRLIHIESMPLHHDESIHAKFTYDVAKNWDYHYDPAYHGPLLYYYNAIFFLLFGDSDFTARVGTALIGVALIAMALSLRPFLGRWPALLWACLMTLSPTYIYFSRFVRHDMYVSAIVTAGLIFILRYIRDRRPSQIYWLFFFAGLLFVTKEDAYIIAFIFVSFPVLFFILAAITKTSSETTAQWRRFVRECFATHKLALGIGFVLFAVVWVTFYTAMFSHPGEWNGFTKAMTYWWGQHKMHRVAGRWFYYVPRLFLYEGLTAVPLLYWVFFKNPSVTGKRLAYAITAVMSLYALFEFLRIDGVSGAEPFTRLFLWAGMALGLAAAVYTVLLTVRGQLTGTVAFFLYWAILAFIIYSWAGEKAPWLLVPVLHPLSFLAAVILTRGLEQWWNARASSALPWVTAILVLYTLYAGVLVNFVYPAYNPKENPEHRHAELMSYVQSTTDVQDITDRIHSILSQLPPKEGLSVAATGQAVWPLSWYLRKDPVYWAAPEGDVHFPVIIVDPDKAADMSAVLKKDYDEQRFQVRAWWVAEPRDAQGKWVNPFKVLRYILTREVFSGIGSTDAVAFFQKDLSKTVTVAVTAPPPTIEYPPGKRAELRPSAVWGRRGPANGEFREPRGLAILPDGSLVVADSKNQRIVILDRNGQFVRSWGSEGSDKGQFKDPGGVAVDHDGMIYVADTWNHRIQKFTSDGQFLAQWGGTEIGFWGPRGIAVSRDRTVYVTDTGNKRVVILNTDGKMTKSWGQSGNKPGEFVEPVGITVDDGGSVYVADTGNHRVQVFDPKGTFIRSFQVAGWTEFYTEPSIGLDPQHRLIVTDSSSNVVARYASNGTLDLYWGQAGEGANEFKGPMGLAVSADGAVYVSDTKNDRIKSYRLP